MLLKIDFKEEDIIYKSNNQIILKLKYYAEYAIGPHFCSVSGYTKEDFDKDDSLKSKSLFIGSKGGLSLY